jgi:uncharacterized protein YoxC
VEDISSRVNSVVEELHTTCETIENDFLGLGQKLQSIYSEASRLVSDMQNAIGLIGGGANKSPLLRLRETAEHSFEQTKKQVEDFNLDLEGMETVSKNLQKLFGHCYTVEKIAAFINVIGLNIGIESSRSSDADELFTIIGKNTREVSDKIEEIVNSILENTKSILDKQGQIRTRIKTDVLKLDHLIEEARKMVENAVTEAEKILGNSVEVLKQGEEHAKEINRLVGEVVEGIQFHDSMSQRIQHIIIALEDVKKIHNPNETPEKLGKTPQDKDRISLSIIRLQHDQLKLPIQETEEVYHKTKDAFSGIYRQIESTLEVLTHFAGKDFSSFSSNTNDNPIITLKNVLKRLQDLLANGNEITKEIRGIALDTSDTASRLMNHKEDIFRINFETRIIALNSIIKSAHLGESGRTLEVLSQEMKRQSDLSNVFVKNVETVIDEVNEPIKNLQTGSCQLVKNDNDGESASLETISEKIFTAFDEFNQQVDNIQEKAEQLKEEVLRVNESIAFFFRLRENLDKSLLSLSDMEKELAQKAGKGKELSEEQKKMLFNRYTMRQERDVHEKYFFSYPEETGQIEAEKIPPADTETEKKPDSSTPLIDMNGDDGSDSEKKPLSKEDFGDNVELF